MKGFDLTDCMMPMISRPGRIASRKNKYFIRSVMKLSGANYAENLFVEDNRKIEKQANKGKVSKSVTGSYSFKTVPRKNIEVNDSPPPNRYTPKYKIVYKNSPTATFGKHKLRDIFGKIEDYTTQEPPFNNPARISGVPFDKQLDRKLNSNTNSPSSRFDIDLSNSFQLPHKVHSFKAYTPRKELFKLKEFQPDYTPNYSSVSKVFKDKIF